MTVGVCYDALSRGSCSRRRSSLCWVSLVFRLLLLLYYFLGRVSLFFNVLPFLRRGEFVLYRLEELI
jgi:hypothetical protein